MVFGHKHELVFLGKELGEQRDYSEQVAAQIDAEIHALVDQAYRRAKDILTEWRPALDRVAATLLQEETIDGRRLAQLCEGELTGRWQDAPDAAFAPAGNDGDVKAL